MSNISYEINAKRGLRPFSWTGQGTSSLFLNEPAPLLFERGSWGGGIAPSKVAPRRGARGGRSQIAPTIVAYGQQCFLCIVGAGASPLLRSPAKCRLGHETAAKKCAAQKTRRWLSFTITHRTAARRTPPSSAPGRGRCAGYPARRRCARGAPCRRSAR